MTDSIVLIGMPGAGKSTVGVLLAKSVGYDFIDSDLVIQRRQNATLDKILVQKGYAALRSIESEVLLSLNLGNTVLATGGSAVYSAEAMQHLAQQATIVYLRCTLPTIEQRLGDWGSRGVASPAGASIEAIYRERTALYQQFADKVVDVDALSPDQVVEKIKA